MHKIVISILSLSFAVSFLGNRLSTLFTGWYKHFVLCFATFTLRLFTLVPGITVYQGMLGVARGDCPQVVLPRYPGFDPQPFVLAQAKASKDGDHSPKEFQ